MLGAVVALYRQFGVSLATFVMPGSVLEGMPAIWWLSIGFL